MKSKQVIMIILSLAAILAPVSQSYAFLDDVFGNDKKSSQKSTAKSSCPIHIGMTMDEVRAKLGDPDTETEGSNGTTEWNYLPDSVAARFQDGAVETATFNTVGSVPFVGGMLSRTADRAEKPVYAKRTGYLITFKDGKVVSFEKRKAQG